MKKLTLILVAVILLLTAACASPEEDTSSTASIPQDTSSVSSVPQEDLEILDTKMGMTIDEVKTAISHQGDVHKEEGYSVIGQTYRGLFGLPADLDKNAIFVFGADDRLREIQYTVIPADNTPYAKMVAFFTDLTGEACVEFDDDGDKVSIWFYRGVFINVMEVPADQQDTPSGSYAVSFFEKEYYASDFAEEYQAYKSQKG